MDVVSAISCIFLFIAAGPFLEELFLTSPSSDRTKRTRPRRWRTRTL